MTHPSRDELAELVGTNADGHSGTRQHVDTCPECRAELTALADVANLLQHTEPESMPADVAARLGAVVADEVRRRNSGADQREAEADAAAAAARTALGTFGANLPFGDKVIGPRSGVRSHSR